jgi:hypothetical protein
MSKDINDPTSVTKFIGKLEPEFSVFIQAIRELILSSDILVAEQIKWNSPAFFYVGDMEPFDPKEYKRDIVVINTRKNIATLVFPTGAKINDTTGLLEGKYTDGRKLVIFKNIEEVKANANNLQNIIREWIKIVK